MMDFLERYALLCFVLAFTLVMTILILLERSRMKEESENYNQKCQDNGGVMFTYRQGRGYAVEYKCFNPNAIIEVN